MHSVIQQQLTDILKLVKQISLNLKLPKFSILNTGTIKIYKLRETFE